MDMRKREKTKVHPISDLIVVGGGASGLMAAVSAARSGVRPLILERMDRIGRKLLATGNGRCNLTNLRVDRTGAGYHGAGREFVGPSLERFGVSDTLRFFETLGLVWKTEDNGRVFPRTDQASAVLDLLRYELKRHQVEEFCESEVVSLKFTGGEFRMDLNNSHIHYSRRVILAAGGRAAPLLGSNGTGYRLAQMLGHTVIEPMPAIVQIRLKEAFLKRLKGVKVQASVSLQYGNSSCGPQVGEILFTDYGISGPPALKLSREVNVLLRQNRKVAVVLDLFPEQKPDEFGKLFETRLRTLAYKAVSDCLVGMIHKRLIPIILESSMIDRDKPCRNLSSAEIGRLRSAVKSWKLEVQGTRSWMDAQVSAGGVCTDEIDPETLESRKVPGLFFAGEIMDVDGDSGGYNLQWAWSSGHSAGIHAAAKSPS
jgi:predicted Rossmann fold flavoprotein